MLRQLRRQSPYDHKKVNKALQKLVLSLCLYGYRLVSKSFLKRQVLQPQAGL